MATQSTFLRLVKPAMTDPADISVINQNMDRIDAAISALDPNGHVPDIADVQAQMTACESAAQAAANAVRYIAPVFDSSVSYGIGQYVVQNGTLYRFVAAHPAGAWNEAHVSPVTLGYDLNDQRVDLNQLGAAVGRIARPQYQADLTVSAGGYKDTHVAPRAGHKYLLISTDNEQKRLGLISTSGTWAVTGEVGRQFCVLELGGTLPQVNGGIQIASYGTALSGSFALFDVTNDPELEAYVRGDYAADSIKWFSGQIKPRLERLEGMMTASLENLLAGNEQLYTVNGSFTYADRMLSGTFYGRADSRVTLLKRLTAQRTYRIKIHYENTNSAAAQWTEAFLTTGYTWENNSVHQTYVNAQESKNITFTYTPSASCWLTLRNMTGSDLTVSAQVYIFDVTELTEGQEAAWAAFGYENLQDTNAIAYTEYAAKVHSADHAAQADSAYGKWRGKKIWICGDSITDFGYYPPALSALLGCAAYHQDGHPGRPLSGCTESLVNNPSQLAGYDLLLIFAGTNDFAGSHDLGTVDSPVGSGTTCGAVKLAISTLQTALPDLRIVFATPLPRGAYDVYPADGQPNQRGKTLKDYAQGIQDVCEAYHIPVIDLYRLIGWNEFNIPSKTLDNLHPTQAASRNELAPLLAAQLNTL